MIQDANAITIMKISINDVALPSLRWREIENRRYFVAKEYGQSGKYYRYF